MKLVLQVCEMQSSNVPGSWALTLLIALPFKIVPMHSHLPSRYLLSESKEVEEAQGGKEAVFLGDQ